MKIIVCISHVPDTTSKINFTEEDTKFDRTGVQFVINPNDEFGLTRAMWFKEKQGANVDVINVGLSVFFTANAIGNLVKKLHCVELPLFVEKMSKQKNY